MSAESDLAEVLATMRDGVNVLAQLPQTELVTETVQLLEDAQSLLDDVVYQLAEGLLTEPEGNTST